MERLRSGRDRLSLVQLRIRGTVVYMPPMRKHIMTYFTVLLVVMRETRAAAPAKRRRAALW